MADHPDFSFLMYNETHLHPNFSHLNFSANLSDLFNRTFAYEDEYYEDTETFYEFMKYIKIIVPIIFGIIFVLGLAGNILVISVIVINQQMRSTTNILIFSLALADLCFIIFCVPFTAAAYVIPLYPFGEVWCKIYQYLIYVCAYASVYTLVVMSLDRYLAVVHPISSMRYRTKLNAILVVVVIWVLILLGNIPLLIDHGLHDYDYAGLRRACVNLKGIPLHSGDEERSRAYAKVFFGMFFMVGYVVPLFTICVLYGFMLKRLLYGVVPGGSQRAESIRSKKRVTKMVVIVVAIFALCWMPIQIIFMVQKFGHFANDHIGIAGQMAANCLAYMNSCVNPILYAFLSENFRRSFRKLLCCGSPNYTKFEYERTNVRDTREKTYTQASTNTTTTTLQTFYNKTKNGSSSGNGNEAVNHCKQTEL